MKTKILAMSALLIILGASGAYAINSYQFGDNTPEATVDLTDQEIQGLQYLREEEKLARDVYIKLYEKWPDLTIFSNIAQSEQRHMDSIKKLLDKYGIDDPVEGNDIGVFTNQELQSLFNQLVIEGEQSLVDALTVGGKIEELDITDLNNYIGLTDKYDITRVYSNLLEGSKNHLRAFVKELTTQGFTYVPFYLSQQEFDDIINQVKISQNNGSKSGKKLGNFIQNTQNGQYNTCETSCLNRLCNRTRVCTP